MDIALGMAFVALLALAALAWFATRARMEAVKARAELDALRGGQLDVVRDAVKSASLEAAQSVSSKLLDDHKRETEAARKEAEERVRAASADLVKQVDGIAQAVIGLQAQVKERGETVDTLLRALESPGGAGALAEIGLANTLKAFGLEQDRDYVLQHGTEDETTGRRLRPDALVFLPADSVLVVDCKASKFLLDIARADGTEGEAEAYDNLARTMNQHLRDLADKDYRSAILAARREAGRDAQPSRIHMMMFLPNDATMDKLTRADPGFRERARREKIIVGGPDVLHCALSLAAAEITLARRVENHEKIVDRTRQLLDGIALALGKADDVGQSIKRAAKSFDEFSRSTNRFLLPRARNVAKLGVEPGKPMPRNLPAFSIEVEDNVIEGEAEEVDVTPPPRLVK
jgi:DNA recombination protein RmuC